MKNRDKGTCIYPTCDLFTDKIFKRLFEFYGGLKFRMDMYLSEYLPIAVFLMISIVLSAAFVIGSVLIGRSEPDIEKLTAYECGFDAFNDSRKPFDVRFYLVAILFIIFDLEIAFLFPWAVALGEIGLMGFWSMMVFLGVLTIGFIYEWRKGALEWE